MGTGLQLHSTMDTKIPTALWKTTLLELVSESPRAVCIERGDWHGVWSEKSGSSSGSDTTSLSLRHKIERSEEGNVGMRKETESGSGLSLSSSLLTQNETYLREPWDPVLDLTHHPFRTAFHGYLTHSQAQALLTQDGHYLVRKREHEHNFLLTFRFNGHLKNFLLYCDESTGFLFVGDKGKSYGTLQELVQEGLTTLYLDQKAGSYIDLMVDLNQFHSLGRTSSSPSPQPSVSRKGVKNHRNNYNSSPSPTQSTLSSSSVERRRTSELRSHVFHLQSFQGLPTCQVCHTFMWGLSDQGLECQDCGLSTHVECMERVQTDCEPSLQFVKEVFGGDLRLLVKASGGQAPFVLQKCIREIENRGLLTEGIYRVSGSRELIEKLRAQLERERDGADLSSHPDMHSLCGLLKLYLRLLPHPLITHQVFQKVLQANGPLGVEMLRSLMRDLPASNQVTLRFLLLHLHRVTTHSDKNKMNAFNLSSVFAPSLLSPAQTSLSTLKTGTNVLEALIKHVPLLFPAPTDPPLIP